MPETEPTHDPTQTASELMNIGKGETEWFTHDAPGAGFSPGAQCYIKLVIAKGTIVDVLHKETIAEYAMLSAEILDSTNEITNQFRLTDIESVLVEGRDMKVLCRELTGNRIVVFMDKTCAHTWIAKRILP